MTDINWGASGEVVYNRTYSRTKPNGEKETWPETVERVVTGNLSLVHGDKWDEAVQQEHDRLAHFMRDFKILPAGRHLWASGVKGRQYLFNCHVSGWGQSFSEHFEFTFLRLMEGGGVGANYSSKYLEKFGAPRRALNVHIVCDPAHADYQEMRDQGLLSTEYDSDWAGAFEVEDSREGWAAALVDLLDTFMSDDEVLHANRVYDVSRVRPKGSRLKTFGGTASGPGPFARMMNEVGRVMSEAAHMRDVKVSEIHGYTVYQVTPLDAMEIDHAIAECVVSGGNRRSARMAIVHWDDPFIEDFLDCKRDGSKHWTTNISVEVDDEFFETLREGEAILTLQGDEPIRVVENRATRIHHRVVEGMLTNGEPGYWNSSLSNVGEVNEVISTNPCGEIALEEWENCFSGDTEIITRDGIRRLDSLVGEIVEVWHDGWHKAEGHGFGIQKLNEVTFVPVRRSTGEGYQRTRSDMQRKVKATSDHRWTTVNRGLVNDLRPGDVVMSDPVTDVDTESERYVEGLRHGVIYGDGCADREYANGDTRYRVRLFGQKQEYAHLFDRVTYPKSQPNACEGWFCGSSGLKDLPSMFAGREYMAGFLAGWLAMDGTVKPNGSVVLASSSYGVVGWLQRHAAILGWDVRGVATHDGETNHGHRTRPLVMVTLGQASHWRVESVESWSNDEVFCVTVPGVERFTLANGLTTMNCNLGHVNLDAFAPTVKGGAVDILGLQEAHRLMTRFLIRATYGDVNDDRQLGKLLSNRRIGVGHFGVQGHLAKQGIAFSEAPEHRAFREELAWMYSVVRKEAREYAFELRIPEPVKVTTVAPTGSIAKLPGVGEGIHPVLYQFFDRRIRFSMADLDQQAQVRKAFEQGFARETDRQDKSGNTVIVVYPTKDVLVEQVEAMGYPASLVEAAADIPLDRMLAFQAMYQREYADNAVSFTVNVPEGLDPDDVAVTLAKWLPSLKGTTLMVDESREQAPYTRITQAQYEAAQTRLVADGVDEECSNGACPIR